MKKNLVLTGMMGVGKSTIGKKVSKQLKYNFIDVDEVIENNENNSIKNIFKIKGEKYFRSIEKKLTLKILKVENSVIALGGGAFINKYIRKETKRSSVTVWLDLSTKSILNRLKNVEKRPLLNDENLSLTINKIYSERKKIYNQSNFRIKCDFLEMNEIVKKIIILYENSRNKN